MAFFGKAQNVIEKHWEGNNPLAKNAPPKHLTETAPSAPTIVSSRVLRSSKPQPAPLEPVRDGMLAEYAELAAAVGIMPHDLGIEKFKAFLVANDLPTFLLSEVVSYMDDKAAKESKDKAGWEWHPLRERDHRREVSFGREAERKRSQGGFDDPPGDIIVPASDFYVGIHARQWRDQTGETRVKDTIPRPGVYNKTIPLHALRKVAAIDKALGDTVGLFVCDYALAPQIQYPDPFLMAVIANPHVNVGTGRFIIDFWDEPGFGIERMVK